MKTALLKTALLIAFSGISLMSHAQQKTTTTLHHGKKLVWSAKPVSVDVQDPKTGKISRKEVLERLKLLTYDGKQVVYGVPRSMEKDIEKKIKNAVKSKKVDRPLFDNREVRIHFTNYIVDTEGKVVFYEVLIFPYKNSLQLYQNEYTPEIKVYLKAIADATREMPAFDKQESPLFSDKILEL